LPHGSSGDLQIVHNRSYVDFVVVDYGKKPDTEWQKPDPGCCMIRTRTRLFYGWWLVLVAALSLLLGPTPIVVFSFGVFLKPLIQEFHVSRGAVSLAFTLHATTTALSVPFAGRLIDRFGPRKIILTSICTSGLILIAANLCSRNIWQLYLFYAAVGIAACGVAPVSYCDVISHWFDRHRGLALGFTMTGLGAGAFIMPSVAYQLITRFGWRMAFGISGAAILLISVPALAMFLKEKPELMGLQPDGGPSAFSRSKTRDTDAGMSFGEAGRTSTLWLMLGAFVLVAGGVAACSTHIAAVLADQGLSAGTAALASSVFGGGQLVGRVGSGYLLDRFFAPRVAAVIFGCVAAGMGLLRIASSQNAAFAAAFVIGLGLGAEVDIMAYLIGRYFGLRFFGAIYGFIFASFGLFTGLGAYFMGAGFDATGSYALPLTLFSVAALVGAALMLRLGPYRYEKLLPEGQRPEPQVLEPAP
jgi:MFS family permease